MMWGGVVGHHGMSMRVCMPIAHVTSMSLRNVSVQRASLSFREHFSLACGLRQQAPPQCRQSWFLRCLRIIVNPHESFALVATALMWSRYHPVRDSCTSAGSRAAVGLQSARAPPSRGGRRRRPAPRARRAHGDERPSAETILRTFELSWKELNEKEVVV